MRWNVLHGSVTEYLVYTYSSNIFITGNTQECYPLVN